MTVYFAESLFLFGFSYKPCCSSEFQVNANIQSLAMQRSFSATWGWVRGWGAKFSYLPPPGLYRFRMAAEEPRMLGRWVCFRRRQLIGSGVTWAVSRMTARCFQPALGRPPTQASRDLPLPCPHTTGASAGHRAAHENNGASVNKSLWHPGLSSQPAGVRAPSAFTSVPLLSQWFLILITAHPGPLWSTLSHHAWGGAQQERSSSLNR